MFLRSRLCAPVASCFCWLSPLLFNQRIPYVCPERSPAPFTASVSSSFQTSRYDVRVPAQPAPTTHTTTDPCSSGSTVVFHVRDGFDLKGMVPCLSLCMLVLCCARLLAYCSITPLAAPWAHQPAYSLRLSRACLRAFLLAALFLRSWLRACPRCVCWLSDIAPSPSVWSFPLLLLLLRLLCLTCLRFSHHQYDPQASHL